MGQIFHPSTNTIARVSIFGGVFILGVIGWVAGAIDRSGYVTETHVIRDQPVPFSHQHHYSGLGIDCRHCHTTAEVSPFAGMPATKVCMTCHSQIWTESPMLEPVRQSWRTGKPMQWTRVNSLPDFVYFNHSIHVAKGVGCVICHGRVDQMPLMYKENTLLMNWCLDCHKQPEKYLRPPEEIYNMAWHPDGRHTDQQQAAMKSRFGVDGTDQLALGQELVKFYKIDKPQLTNCSVCHR